MTYLKEIKLSGTTDGSGDLTADATRPVLGRLYAIHVDASNLDATGDVTISTQNHDAAATLLTLTNNNSTADYYPRELVHDDTGTALTGTSGGDRELPLMVGVPRMVVAQGGASKAVSCILFYFED